MAEILLLRADRGVTTDVNGVTKWEDQSGADNHMIPNTTLLSWPSKATDGDEAVITFDGVDDFLVHWDTVGKNFGDFGTGDFTISLRMRHNPLNTYDQFCSKGSQGAGGFVFGFWVDGSKVNFGTNSIYLTDTTSVLATKYYVATIVRNGDAGYLYVDGELVASNATYFASQNISNTYSFSLGSRSSVPDHFFAGNITDVKIDDTAQNQAQIKSYVKWINSGRKGSGFAKFNKFGGF